MNTGPFKMKGFSGFKPESVPDGEGEVNLSKSSGLGPRTSFGGSKNPELDKNSPNRLQKKEKRKEKKLDKKIKKRNLKESKEKFSKLSTKDLMAKKDGTYNDKSESRAEYIERRKTELKK